jgi:hypothetical protein
MLIDQPYFKGDKIALRDMDGSEVFLTFEDALNLFIWLRHNMDELERRNLELHQKTNNDDEYLHT